MHALWPCRNNYSLAYLHENINHIQQARFQPRLVLVPTCSSLFLASIRLLVSTRHEHLLIHVHSCFSHSHHHHLSLLVIAGTIPAFSTLTNLQQLNLNDNSLTGKHSTRSLVDTCACLLFILTSPTPLSSCVHRHDSCI